MSDISFLEMTITSCSRKRKDMNGTITTLSSLLCTPRAPVDAETLKTLGLGAPHILWEVYLQGNPDIKKGDVFYVDGIDHGIHKAEPYTWLPTQDTRTRLVLEDLTNFNV